MNRTNYPMDSKHKGSSELNTTKLYSYDAPGYAYENSASPNRELGERCQPGLHLYAYATTVEQEPHGVILSIGDTKRAGGYLRFTFGEIDQLAQSVQYFQELLTAITTGRSHPETADTTLQIHQEDGDLIGSYKYKFENEMVETFTLSSLRPPRTEDIGVELTIAATRLATVELTPQQTTHFQDTLESLQTGAESFSALQRDNYILINSQGDPDPNLAYSDGWI